MAGCIQCDDVVTEECSMCKQKYYIDKSGVCQECNSSCFSCDGPNTCTKCALGYTMKDGQTEGRCRECQSPCLTCEGNPKYCTSCVTGFTQLGWHCRNNTFVGFRLVVNVDPDVIMTNIDTIVCKILAMFKDEDPTAATSDCDKSEVVFN